MRTAVLFGLSIAAGLGSGAHADSIVEDPIVAYIKIPLWGGWVSRWYVYTESGFVGPP